MTHTLCVFFRTEDAFIREPLLGLNETVIPDVIDKSSYRHVVALSVEADTRGAALEKAYAHCQNLEQPWLDCERSAMMGDVFVLDGQAWIVAAIGFRPVQFLSGETARPDTP